MNRLLSPSETQEARKSRFLAIGVAKAIKHNPQQARQIAYAFLEKASVQPAYTKWVTQWQSILTTHSDTAVIRLLVSKGSVEQDLPSLRQTSPFIGLVPAQERNKRLKRWKKIISGI